MINLAFPSAVSLQVLLQGGFPRSETSPLPLFFFGVPPGGIFGDVLHRGGLAKQAYLF